MGKLGEVLAAGGKGFLKGMENYGGPMGGIPGSGLDMMGGPGSGISLMNALFDKLGIFKKKPTEADPHTSVGPRD